MSPKLRKPPRGLAMSPGLSPGPIRAFAMHPEATANFSVC